MINFLIFDDDCGVCSFIADLLKKLNLNYEFLGSSQAEKLMISHDIDFALSQSTIVLIRQNDLGNSVFIEAQAVFEILADLFNLSDEERSFLFNKSLIKLFNPLYRLFAKYRRDISIFFKLNACKIR